MSAATTVVAHDMIQIGHGNARFGRLGCAPGSRLRLGVGILRLRGITISTVLIESNSGTVIIKGTTSAMTFRTPHQNVERCRHGLWVHVCSLQVAVFKMGPIVGMVSTCITNE